MKSIRPKSNKIIASVITVAVIVLLGIGYYFVFVAPANEATTEETSTGTDIKKQSVDQSSKGQQTGSDPSPAPQPLPGSNKSSVNADITSANQDQTSLYIRTLIQTVTNSGTCTLTMQGPNGKSYTAQAPVQALPSSSTCRGFDIPLNQLSAGSWSIKITFSNDDLTASASKDVSIQ